MLGMNRSFSASPAAAVTESVMFCRQCEQTKDNYACTSLGVCGKTPETAMIQDALIQVVKAVSIWAVAARKAGVEVPPAVNEWTIKAAFSTMTNVNFSEDRIADYIHEGMALKDQLSQLVPIHPSGPVADLILAPELTADDLEEFGQSVSVPSRQQQMGDDDCFSLNEIGTYGLKGLCAYASHVWQIYGTVGEDIMAGIHEIWAKLASSEADMDGLLANAIRVGEVNAAVLALLDAAHADTYGKPEPTEVRMSAVKGKAILVSGHDMADLKALLEQTEGTGINVYTHGEMLPAHGYPELKKYAHLVGNYGTAWQNQKIEFATFPGPIIVTTNCIIEPRRVYKDRVYTMNEVGFDGVQHIGEDRDFSVVIGQAHKGKGFARTIEPARFHTLGFNHRVVLPLADQIISAAKSGSLSRIFLIGGCDGTVSSRETLENTSFLFSWSY
jgi:hydroxylamine reductase